MKYRLQKAIASYFRYGTVLPLVCCFYFPSTSQTTFSRNLIRVGDGWAANSINTVIFRKNALVTHQQTQYIAYYDANGRVVLGKRKLGTEAWYLHTTSYKGNVMDAHNSISIMTDGDGYLHMAWDHHNNKLHYAKSSEPGAIDKMYEFTMTGKQEEKVSYPEFYAMPNGHLLFLYRDGASGQGNLVLNSYDVVTRKWQTLQRLLIDGEEKRNAYWQAFVDKKGTIHLSWVWRESSDVASNHDICYAKSIDGGKTWMNSKNTLYQLPITKSSAEYAVRIPEGSGLINQTSMTATGDGKPVIASYWIPANSDIPQYHVIYQTDKGWKVLNTGFRKSAFSLAGEGTKRIPISRPQVLTWGKGSSQSVAIIYRDVENGNKVGWAECSELDKNNWTLSVLSDIAVGSWEPTFDTKLWDDCGELHLFVQYTEQQDAEGRSALGPQPVYVLETKHLTDSVYLFAYFKNNGQDGLHLARSFDGFNWKALKNDSSFLQPRVGVDKLMRDPCIIRGGDGWFHMVWTVSWNEKGIGYARSRDLINWSEQQYIPVMAEEDSARNCWAPEITYDKRSRRYMIYWSTTIGGKYPADYNVERGYNHRIYYVLTKDFSKFTRAKLLYDKGFNVIDASIVPVGKKFAMFLKDETRFPPQKNIRLAWSRHLQKGYGLPSAPITGDYWAEGPTTLFINGKWILYFDKYRDHQFGALVSTDLKNWTESSIPLQMPAGIRHGSVLKITAKEWEQLKPFQ